MTNTTTPVPRKQRIARTASGWADAAPYNVQFRPLRRAAVLLLLLIFVPAVLHDADVLATMGVNLTPLQAGMLTVGLTFAWLLGLCRCLIRAARPWTYWDKLRTDDALLVSFGLPSPLRQAAGHKAAHAVVATAMGLTPYDLNIRNQTPRVCVADGQPNRPEFDPHWARLVAAAAALCWDAEHSYDAAPEVVDGESVVASAEAAYLVTAGVVPPGLAGELTVDALLVRAREYATALLDVHAGTVEQVTDLLARKGYLTARDAATLLADVRG